MTVRRSSRRRPRLGPYQIESPIGAGGMGEVYKATDTRLERTIHVVQNWFSDLQARVPTGR